MGRRKRVEKRRAWGRGGHKEEDLERKSRWEGGGLGEEVERGGEEDGGGAGHGKEEVEKRRCMCRGCGLEEEEEDLGKSGTFRGGRGREKDLEERRRGEEKNVGTRPWTWPPLQDAAFLSPQNALPPGSGSRTGSLHGPPTLSCPGSCFSRCHWLLL